MHIIDLVADGEENEFYEQLAFDNLRRQYSFLKSLVDASVGLERDMISFEIIRALNYHAISCLHATAGEFRRCKVTVGEDFKPPPHHQVQSLMHMFVDEVNRKWDKVDPIFLATFVLWKLNYIHPFVNGNGRTARAACYFVLCMRLGRWLEGDPILPELIRRHRDEYVEALAYATTQYRKASEDEKEGAQVEDEERPHPLLPLHTLLTRLIEEQRQSAFRLPAFSELDVRASLPVDDVAAARQFYEGQLGFEALQSDENDFITYQSGDHSSFSIYHSDGANQATALTWVVTDKVEELVKSLAEKGISFEQCDIPGAQRVGDVHIIGEAKHAWFKDPAGNVLGISSERSHVQPRIAR